MAVRAITEQGIAVRFQHTISLGPPRGPDARDLGGPKCLHDLDLVLGVLCKSQQKVRTVWQAEIFPTQKYTSNHLEKPLVQTNCHTHTKISPQCFRVGGKTSVS